METATGEVNLHRLASHHIAVEIKKLLQYKSFYYELQKVATSEEVKLIDFKNTLRYQIKTGNLDIKLRNMVYHWLKERCCGFKPLSSEPLDYMKRLQESWESRVWKSVLSMANDLGAPLARGRLNSEQELIQENWSELSQWEIGPHYYYGAAYLGVPDAAKNIVSRGLNYLSRFRPVYSPKDFLDVILQITSPNYHLNCAEKLWSSLASVPIKVKSLRELKCLFADLTTGEPHYGLIRHLVDSEGEFHGSISCGVPRLIQIQRTKLGEIVASKNLAPVAQEYLKKGCPPALRAKMWQLVLGSDITKEHSEYYQELKQSVLKCELLIDRLILKDVQLTAANDDQYFVFEDSLYQVLLTFSRDTSLLELFDRSSKSPLTATVKGKHGGDGSVIYPPNGIVPFHGFTMYVAPLCYIFDDPESLYFTFRSLYTRYWYRLHEISSHENGIVGLCILFEKLLHRHETQLWFHLRSLRVLPLRVVFKWLVKGFSGYLPAEQVLQLWDLMLAYNSVQLLPLFAVGVLSIRRENLIKAQQAQTVDAVLADLSSIAVLPVLQLALSKETF